MSYTIHITFQDGEPVVSTAGEVPDGVWSIGGHGDDTGVGINVVHKTIEGQHIAEAQHYRSLWSYDEANFVAASRDDLPTRLIRLGFTREQAEHYAERGRIKYGRTVLDPEPAQGTPQWEDVQLPDAPVVGVAGEFKVPEEFHLAKPAHNHLDDGTVEGCPGCFPGGM